MYGKRSYKIFVLLAAKIEGYKFFVVRVPIFHFESITKKHCVFISYFIQLCSLGKILEILDCLGQHFARFHGGEREC